MIGVGGDRRRDKENGTAEEIRERGGMPSHRGLSSPTKEDYRICLLVDHHRCRSVLSPFPPSHPLARLLSSSLLVPSSLVPLRPSRLFQFLSPERNAMATLRGTKFRRKFLRKSHCHLSRSLIRRTYRSSGRSVSTRVTVSFCSPETQRARSSVFITAR